MRQNRRRIACLLWTMVLFIGVSGCANPTPSNSSSGSSSTENQTAFSVTVTSEQTSHTVTKEHEVPSVSSAVMTEATTDGRGSTVKSTAKSTTKRALSNAVSSMSSSLPSSPQKTSGTTKISTTGTTKKPINGVWDLKNNDVGFGFYSGLWEEDKLKSNYVNTVFCNDISRFELLDKYNIKAWMYVYDVYQLIIEGYDWWTQRFDSLWKRVQESGYEDVVLGWYIDEPSNMEAVKAITKYAKETYGKRFLICFMVNTVDPNVWGGYQGENCHISRDNVQYLTDIAVDFYWSVDENQSMYEALYKTLHEKMAADCKVWYIPTTHAGYDLLNYTEEEIRRGGNGKIKHLQYMYEWLKKEPPQNRGGILVFAYDFDSPYEKIYGLYQINEKTGGLWNHVMQECIRIGREICTGKIPDSKE